MAVELVNASAVIVAHDVNLSIFRPPWLRDQGILTDDELQGDVVATPVVVRIGARGFELTVLPDRLQFRPALQSDNANSDLLRVLGGIVSALPHTPFTAMGFNFGYRIIQPKGIDFAQWNRSRFASPVAFAVIPSGAQGTAHYGTYFSFDALDMRVKVDLKPIRKEGFAMHSDFNFHRDLPQDPSIAEILRYLANWNTAALIAHEIAEKISAGESLE